MPGLKTWQLDGRVFTGLLIICVGIIFLLGNIYPDFNFWHFAGRLWPVILIIIGLYILLSQNRFRWHAATRASSHSRMVGDLRIDYKGKEIGDVGASQLIGDLTIDLTGALLKSGVNTLNVSGIIGDTSIFLPSSFPLKISARSIAGDLRFDNRQEEGFFPKLEYTDDRYEQAGEKLLVTVSSVIGDISMQRI
jgi:predicted membrane protein